MENSNILKQAKSDIFKELYPIINFYIKKGAKPNALKKYYKNKKRFNDILDDIKNKAVNLVTDESEYHKLVREILDDMLDDFIAKEKDEEYKNKQNSKMKHIKEFNSYNEDLSTWTMLGAGFFTGLFLKNLIKDLKEKRNRNEIRTKFLQMSPKEQDDYRSEIDRRKKDINLKILIDYIGEFFRKTGDIKIIDNYVWYIFQLNDLIIKIHKFDKIIKWSKIEFKGYLHNYYIPEPENFVESISLSDEDIQELKIALEKDKKEMEE